MISAFIFRQRIQPKAWASYNYQWGQKHCNHKCEFNVHGSVYRKNIPIYIQQDATLHSLFYMETALHVSGGTTTHHRERIQLNLQHLVFVTPLLLPASTVEELELVKPVPTFPRCNVTQFIWKLLYMFRVVPPPIIRSAYDCIYSILYLPRRYCYLPLPWKSWNW